MSIKMVRAADFSDPLFSLKQYEWNSSEAFLLDLYHEILNQVCKQSVVRKNKSEPNENT